MNSLDNFPDASNVLPITDKNYFMRVENNLVQSISTVVNRDLCACERVSDPATLVKDAQLSASKDLNMLARKILEAVTSSLAKYNTNPGSIPPVKLFYNIISEFAEKESYSFLVTVIANENMYEQEYLQQKLFCRVLTSSNSVSFCRSLNHSSITGLMSKIQTCFNAIYGKTQDTQLLQFLKEIDAGDNWLRAEVLVRKNLCNLYFDNNQFDSACKVLCEIDRKFYFMVLDEIDKLAENKNNYRQALTEHFDPYNKLHILNE